MQVSAATGWSYAEVHDLDLDEFVMAVSIAHEMAPKP